ncbi:Diapolycopene oxygenase [uncultured Clostridium sp.]|uniref:phytoene desaturase family protein n=1 Tax=uncultured Clostridium sp. TaxID=59620 RepID=UPI0008218EC6|nr:NAD(P)/FAD-dependent oxidoreductase [uncultured Clostridium sp.]SCJ63573.1 Diapolycopene oxygenase [uncultured Clostridium sp.]
MNEKVLVIGAGLSGLTSASLLAKRGFDVTIVDAQYKPGGSCGIFKRKDNIFEQGSAMLYGFGEKGFNSHRFVFNSLEEPINIIKHDELYVINYGDKRIVFYDDINKFTDELGEAFPEEKDNFKKFYKDIEELYLKVIAEDPAYISPDVVKKEDGLKKLLNHPLAYVKFLGYLNSNTESLLKKYFKSEEIFKFFDKLTSTYCYTTVKETPAVLSTVMFVDNHYGGSYYPAGSTLHLVGKLEKVIEENGGKAIYNKEVTKILVKDNKAIGVELDDGSEIKADFVIHSGTVWNLYNKLLLENVDKKKVELVNSLTSTYPSLVLFALVKEEAIPEGTLPIEMLVSNTDEIDEGEVTVYILSIDDKSLCKEGYHIISAIGPSFKEWPLGFKNNYKSKEYDDMKKSEIDRIINVLEKRFPKIKDNICHVELSTPTTLNRYAMKYKGAVAGPKQKLGQHMLKRLHTESEIDNLYNCGESTVMGTGTPAVTVSGVSAANMILRKLNMEEYEYKDNTKEYVNIINKPVTSNKIIIGNTYEEKKITRLASQCQYCEQPVCERNCKNSVPIRDINRRLAVGNYYGAKRLLKESGSKCKECYSIYCEKCCIRNSYSSSVKIKDIMELLENL